MTEIVKAENITKYLASYSELLAWLESAPSGVAEMPLRRLPTGVVKIALDDSETIPAIAATRHIISLCEFIYTNRSNVNQTCKFNAQAFGNSLESRICPEGPITIHFLFDCLIILYRFALELIILSDGDLNFDRKGVFDFIKAAVNTYPVIAHYDQQVDWIVNVLPGKIATSAISQFNNSEWRNIDVISLASLDLKILQKLDVAKVNGLISRGETLLGPNDAVLAEIQARENVLNAHKERIEKYTNDYNFVGLSEGFKTLQAQKQREIWTSRFLAAGCWCALIFVPYKLMGLMIDPASFFSWLGYEIQLTDAQAIVTAHSWKLAVPFLTVEFILLYFLRIQLINIKACGAQMLQINLRQSLCQFIQEYVNHAQEMKGKDEKLLERFETLIFSPIVAQETDIPASLEGISQLVEIIKPKKPAG